MKTHTTILTNLTLFMACLSVPLQAMAEGISIERASGRTRDLMYLMDATIRYDLNDSVLEALTHGIQLRFDVTVEVRRERNWIWDKTIKSVTLSYELEHQPLGNNYLVTDLNRGKREQLQNLEEALQYLGTIRDYPLIDRNELDPDQSYNCIIMSELKIRSLPLPLQPLAYISPKWHLTSQWYEWVLR